MNKLIAILLVVFISISISPAPLVAATSLSTVGRSQAACVNNPSNQAFRRGSQLRFTNFCQDRVFINVCVRYDNGTSKLYSSGRRIQVGGFMNVFTDPFNRPVDVAIAYGIFDAAIPPPCNSSS